MPTYSMKGTMLETMEDPSPFDVSTSKSTMGAMTEVFRVMAGVRRSAHPTHAVAALGPRAEHYTADHHRSRSPCGVGSPFRKLSEHEGSVLVMGSGIGKVTSHHTIEDQVASFPFAVYLPGVYTKRVIFADGHAEDVEVLVHSPTLGRVRIDANAEKEREIFEHMRRRGIVKEGLVGAAPSQLFKASDLDAMLVELLAQGVTIYGVP
jgi:aminoglycoside 3-N-acetyltransferase